MICGEFERQTDQKKTILPDKLKKLKYTLQTDLIH